MGERTLWLGEASWSGAHLTITYGVDAHRFTTSLWWEGLDLDALAVAIGPDALRRLVFHIAAFEAMKGASLRPDVFDLGPYADLGTERVPRRCGPPCSATCGASGGTSTTSPTTTGPTIVGPPAAPVPPVAVDAAGPARAAVLRRRQGQPGGGAGARGGGRALRQLRLLALHLRAARSRSTPSSTVCSTTCTRPQRLRHWVFDDLLDVPVERLAPELGVRSVTAAETPASLFGALPARRWRAAAPTSSSRHERSADAGNLVWERTGEEINHQWGKSLEAERLLRDYVHEELVAGLSYSSVLKPVHDVLIFRALARVARRGARHPLVQRRQALVPPLRQVRLRVARLPGVPPGRDEPRHLR